MNGPGTVEQFTFVEGEAVLLRALSLCFDMAGWVVSFLTQT